MRNNNNNNNNNNGKCLRLRLLVFGLLGGGLLLAASAFTVSSSNTRCVGAASSTCSSLQASTATLPIPTTSPHNRVKTAKKAAEEPGLLEPTGVHHPFHSLAPLSEARAWAAREGQYFNGLIEANGGASVFKGHPGLAVTFLTDHASCEWFLSQSQEVLDRQDGAYFGPIKCKKDYIGESLPTLITNKKESHQAFREHALRAFRSRVPFAQSAITNATDTFYTGLRDNGVGEYTLIYDFFLQQTIHFLHEWIYGMGVEGGQPLPPFKDFMNANPLDVSVLLELEMDTPVAQLAAKLAQRSKKPSAEQLASVDSIAEAIRSSDVWAGFVEMLKGSNVNTKDLERSFMFTTNFQSAGAIAKGMMPVVATLTNNPEFLEKLRKEVDGNDLTFQSVRGAENFPLLDSFHWEINRMFPAPAFTVKEAKMDVVVPTSSGKKYKIKKGEMLMMEQALGQMDPSVFGPDAREFNPERFVGNPELKKKVFAYGYVDHDKVDGQWGCAAHAIGMLDGILKIIYGRWVQEAEWELTSVPVISPDEFVAEVGPADMSFAKVTSRKK